MKINKYLFVPTFIVVLSVYFTLFINNVSECIGNRIRIFIPTNSTYDDVLRILEKNNILKSVNSFKIGSYVLRYNNFVKSGSYIIPSNSSNFYIIRLLKSGKQSPIKLTLHNIETKAELIDYISMKLDINKKQLTQLLSDNDFLKSRYNLNTENIMVMFVPNTYELYWNINTKAFLDRIYSEYKKFWNNYRKARAQKLGLSPEEISILASIVKAETIYREEAPIIARVYYNRLRKKMKLMSDPTVRFATQKRTANRILHIDCKINSPYNTYVSKGLPPGPINMPDISYIDAVLNMPEHNLLYFCALADLSGKHIFSSSYAEHLRHARKYWRALNKRKIYK